MMTRTALAAAIATTAVASLAVAAWTASAAPGDGDATFTPITPCRLFDDRPAPHTIGPNNTPLTSGTDRTIQITGTTGDCTIPTDATAIAMNVTIANPTEQSNLRVWPADQPKPTASNLNWLPGQSPTPNKVDVALSPTGAITLANHNGHVNVIADAVGYYASTSLTDLHSELDALRATVDELSDRSHFGVESITVNTSGLVLSRSPGLRDATVVRQKDKPAGAYCIVIGDSIDFDTSGAVGSVQRNNRDLADVGIMVTTNFGNPCDTTEFSVAVDTFRANSPTDLPFTVIIPRAIAE